MMHGQKNIKFLGIFSNNTPISNSIKIHPVVTELFHANGWTERKTGRRTHMTTLIFAFRNFVKASKICLKNGWRQSPYKFIRKKGTSLLAVLDVLEIYTKPSTQQIVRC